MAAAVPKLRDDPSDSFPHELYAPDGTLSALHTLDKVPAGKSCTVNGIYTTNVQLHARLLVLGLVEMAKVRVIDAAPFGDPIYTAHGKGIYLL